MNDYVQVYTDGSCLTNPGKAGYACILQSEKNQQIITGSLPYSTNNRTELISVIYALRAVPPGSTVVVNTDSQYVANAVNCGHLSQWQQNGWQRIRTGEPVSNRELWLVFLRVVEERQLKVSFIKVAAHKANNLNNRVDFLARQAAKQQSKYQILSSC